MYLELYSGLLSRVKYVEKVRYIGKSIPLQALTGPEVFRSLRLPDFKAVGI